MKEFIIATFGAQCWPGRGVTLIRGNVCICRTAKSMPRAMVTLQTFKQMIRAARLREGQ